MFGSHRHLNPAVRPSIAPASSTMSFLIRTPLDKIKPFYSEAAKTHYTQLFQHFPILERFYLPFEKNFHAEPCVNFAKATWPALPLALCTAYALMIVIGTRVMKNREKFDWRGPLAYWNLCLSLFRYVALACPSALWRRSNNTAAAAHV